MSSPYIGGAMLQDGAISVLEFAPACIGLFIMHAIAENGETLGSCIV